MYSNNPKGRTQFIIDELKVNPAKGFSEMFSVCLEKFSISEVTFSKDWGKAQIVFSEYQKTLKEAKDKVSINLEVKALESGLKSKFDRLAILQNQVDEIMTDLKVGLIEKPNGEFRELNPVEKSKLRQVLKEIQAEISKIDGDYAPTKTDLSINKGFTFDIDDE